MRTVDKELHLERHVQMLDYQKQIKPFVATIRDLQEVWALKTTSATFLTLQRLVGLGLCITRGRGNRKVYYAVRNKK